ncbi:formate dehydrogenase alpha subunit [Plasticicumulans lactativorans]|uniref:Formate dehydrogenase alpha subunit n=1 Tax=Plasticicumulans lactativorans TaxID=1133106 RepID=A0A4R2L9K7_9GAMM|nr:formate dehydrogenase subunit alpha [Plasticicumulans lactativorans]TCO80939.1 formate dehydrogenase alpha subunit [Plasticicumulans lactativorans]
MKLTRKGMGEPAAAGVFRGRTVTRREFLAGSGLAVGSAALAGLLAPGLMRRARAADPAPAPAAAPVEIRRTICGHCSVGCGVYAEVRSGVWVGQEPAFDHPINLGSHCAKGASLREHGHGERRLKYPMKLVDGQWTRVTWQQALDELGARLLQIREASGPDSVYWLGSSKHSNEQAYLFRKFAAFWGSNNIDHQARICHSTTVAGVANTWGYGAMTNSYNDIVNAKAVFFIGSNAAEAHPVSMQHVLRAKERGAKMIVCDPRFTRTAAHADIYVRLRPGTDVPFIWGLLWHIFGNGWEDRSFIEQRVYGLDEVRAEVAKWPPAEVERVTGVKPELVRRVAQTMAENRPGTFVWCMGGTQHSIGNNNTRAYCIFQLALGNLGVAGGGTNIFRGHDNVQGATDVGPNSDSLPAYYGLSPDAWKHWARVWDVDLDYLKSRFDPGEYDDGKGGRLSPMNMPGITVSRWIDGVLEDGANITQKHPLRAMVFWGHAPNSQTRGPQMKQAMEKLDLLVIIDPYPTAAAVMHERRNDTWLLPACTQFETTGSCTASNRSIQWRDKVIEPLFESKPDHVIMYLFAKRFGFAEPLFKHIAVNGDEPSIEDLTREFNRGSWTIGYTGQSPERLKAHQKNWHVFSPDTLRAEGGPPDVAGDYYGLPWPCWGTPALRHPGSPNLYDTRVPVAEGGLCFRANFGVERNGVNLLAEGSYPKGSEIEDGYPEFSFGLLQKLGWDGDLTADELAAIRAVGGDKPEAVNWKTDLSGGIQRVAIKHGCAPFGNAKARCVVWNFPDAVPVHREPVYASRRELAEQYPTYADRKAFFRLPTRYASIQARDYSRDFPLIHTSGRLVEYEGGGEETRSNPWLAELQQHMFVEINPVDANNAGVRDGQDVWLEGPEGGRIRVRAMVTRRVGPGVVFTPFHFAGHFQGRDLRSKYPAGSDPYVLGESNNIATTYGYDSVTMMQETKVTLCRVIPA